MKNQTCRHARTELVTSGRARFVPGEGYDDDLVEEIICLDCGQAVTAEEPAGKAERVSALEELDF